MTLSCFVCVAWLVGTQASAQSFPAQLVVSGDDPILFQAGSDVLLGRGFLGVEMLDVSPELRRFFGGSDDVGVLVSRVSPNSPSLIFL